MKRLKEDLAESHETKSLKAASLLVVFETMSLPERQAIIPELLKMAKIVNGYALNHVDPKFVRFACSGEQKEWTHEEIERGWEAWNFFRRRAAGGALYFVDSLMSAEIWSVTYVNPDNSMDFRDNRWHQDEIMSRSEFFDTILDHFTIPYFVARKNPNYDCDDLHLLSIMRDKDEGIYEDLESPYRGGYIRDIVEDARIAKQ